MILHWWSHFCPVLLPSPLCFNYKFLSQFLQHYKLTFALGPLRVFPTPPSPHPHLGTNGFFLYNLIGLISSHHLDSVWIMSCSRETSQATSSLPVVLWHMTLLYILPRSSHYLKLSYSFICLLTVFSYKYKYHRKENASTFCSILLPEMRISPVAWKAPYVYLLAKGMIEWVAKEITLFWGLLCTTT